MTEETQITSEEIQAVEEEVKIEDPKAVLDALARAKNDAKKYREEKEKLELDLNSRDQMIAEYSAKILKQKVKEKFEDAGIKDGHKFFKFINFNELDFNENDEIVGFDSQLEQLKSDFPEIFDPKLRVGGQADGAIATSVSTRITASELQAAKVLGRL